jgi:hypothetical protein
MEDCYLLTKLCHLQFLLKIECWEWMIRFGEIEKLRRKRPWLISMYYTDICLEGLKGHHTNLSMDLQSSAEILTGPSRIGVKSFLFKPHDSV